MAGSIRKTPSGSWQLRASAGFNPDGTRRTITETVRGSKRSAELRLAELVNKGARGQASSGATLGEAVDEYLANPRLGRQTVYKARTVLAHLPPAWRKMKISKISGREIERLYAELETAGVGAPTLRILHTVLGAAVQRFVRWGTVDRNPFKSASPPPEPKSRSTMLTEDQLSALTLAASINQLHALWLRLHIVSGARRSEVLALRWSAVTPGKLMLHEALERDREVKGLKTDDRRDVAIDKVTGAMIVAWQQVQRERALAFGVPLDRDPYLISSEIDSSRPWRPDVATQLFGRLCKRAGISGVRLHDLRHTAVSFVLADGMDPVTASKRFGHSVRTMLKVYGHVIEGRDREAAEMMARRLGG